jgi:hypothetical protein
VIQLTATARCIGRCEWTAGPGDPAEVDHAAEAHTLKAGHPTATAAVSAPKTTAGTPPAAAPKE